MGGLNAADRLKAGGIDAGKGTAIYVDPDDVFLAPPDHPLHDLRSLWPVDSDLADAIDRGVLRPHITVRDDGIPKGGKKRRLTCIDGSRRTKATALVNEHRLSRKLAPLKVQVDIVSGTDAEMMLLRLRLNGQRRDETPSTLAHKLAQGEKAGLKLEEMAAAYGCSVKLANLALRFRQCAAKVRAAFDSGELPLEVLGAFVDVPPEEQEAFLGAVRVAARGGDTSSPAKAKKAVLKAKKKEGRAPERRPKAVPAGQLVKAASAVTLSLPAGSRFLNFGEPVRQLAVDIISATLEYAAGDGGALRSLVGVEYFGKLEAARKSKK